MNQVCQQFFAGARFALNQHGRLRVGDAQRHFDGATNRGRLSDDSVFAVAFMQSAFQAHHFGRKVIALESRAYLISDSLDQCSLVIFETIARFAPNQTEQPKRVTGNAHRRHQSGAASERRIKHDPQRQRQIGFEKF